MTVSQNTSSTNKKDKTEITYYSLSEFAKYVDYKKDTDTIFSRMKRENISLLGSNKKKQERIENFENVIIPNLSTTYEKENLILSNDKKLLQMDNENLTFRLKNESKRKWNWGIWGVVLGSIAGFIAAIGI